MSPASGVLCLQQSQSATPEGFELPGAQGSGQRPEGQRRDWQLMPFGAFLTWSLRPAPPRANPQRECPGDTRPRGQCTPYCGEGGSCFPCTGSTFTPRIDSHHCGTWDSPVGKPRGKASKEGDRSLDPHVGKRDTAAAGREEMAGACPHTR